MSKIEFSSEEALNKSRQIVNRIRKRDIYKFVNEVIVQNPKKLDQNEVIW